MNERTLFLAWQDGADTRLWFPVGRLDAAGSVHRRIPCSRPSAS